MIVRIPDLLSAMSYRLRVRLQDGSAVHATEDTVQELQLLRQLHWEEENAGRVMRSLKPGGGTDLHAFTPADLQRWWLIASNACPIAMPGYMAQASAEAIKRAAVCAELALLAETESSDFAARALALSRETYFGAGTNEGAKAVLEFVIREMSGCIGIAQERPWCVKILNTYRRELEAFQ